MRFEEFAATRLPAVLRFAGVLTADRALAEDVVQEVLIHSRRAGRGSRGPDPPQRHL
jgi:DNA-directed RNA polymerase specialized sigma24 family protein